MTRILYLPTESSLFTLESTLPPGRLILAVNSGKWLPPPGVPRPERPLRTLRAVRLGRETILIFRPMDMEQIYTAPAPAPSQLGQRQLEVLQCIAKGMTARQVAAQLGLSRRTVYLHLASIRHSLSAISTAEAVHRAAELGLCQPPVKGSGG